MIFWPRVNFLASSFLFSGDCKSLISAALVLEAANSVRLAFSCALEFETAEATVCSVLTSSSFSCFLMASGDGDAAFFCSSRGRGFFACSALKPGGGNGNPSLPCVVVSEANPLRGSRIASAWKLDGEPLEICGEYPL